MTQQKAAIKLFDVIVVGGGLSGVMLGQQLEHHRVPSGANTTTAIDWKLLEARSVLGGRLANNNNDKGGNIDMGGAWIWPFAQPYIKSLVKKLNLSTFLQPDEPSSTRIHGGAVEIVKALASDIKTDHNGESRVQLNTAATACTLIDNAHDGKENIIRLDTKTGDDSNIFLARRVVFAVPPNVLHKHVTFDPPLSKQKQAAMAASHTWMAGVTKVALEYPKRFWSLESSNMGLPQHFGPAFQVYDSSTRDDSVSALTFFALVKPEHEVAWKDDAVLAKQVAQQMSKVWTNLREHEAANQVHYFTNHHVKRWPLETYISEDDRPIQVHPRPEPVTALSQREWNGLLEFAGSETDQQSPGVLEGALGAANRVFQSLQSFLSSLQPDRPCELAAVAAKAVCHKAREPLS